jgi:DNA-directed RNA polymerase specialized sigma24 family protein
LPEKQLAAFVNEVADRIDADFRAGGLAAINPEDLPLLWAAAWQLACIYAAGMARRRPEILPEDIASTTIFQLLKQFPTLVVNRRGARFTTILHKVVSNRIIDLVRGPAIRRRRPLTDDVISNLVAVDDPLRRIVIREVREMVLKLRSHEKLTIALELMEIIDLSEALKRTQLPPSTYYKRRAALKNQLKRYWLSRNEPL